LLVLICYWPTATCRQWLAGSGWPAVAGRQWLAGSGWPAAADQQPVIF